MAFLEIKDGHYISQIWFVTDRTNFDVLAYVDRQEGSTGFTGGLRVRLYGDDPSPWADDKKFGWLLKDQISEEDALRKMHDVVSQIATDFPKRFCSPPTEIHTLPLRSDRFAYIAEQLDKQEWSHKRKEPETPVS